MMNKKKLDKNNNNINYFQDIKIHNLVIKFLIENKYKIKMKYKN